VVVHELGQLGLVAEEGLAVVGVHLAEGGVAGGEAGVLGSGCQGIRNYFVLSRAGSVPGPSPTGPGIWARSVGMTFLLM
jgi:hypothetical protein